MYLLGMFVGQQFPQGAEQDDLDFFTFPEIDPAIGTDAIEAPIDGFMMAPSPRTRTAPRSCSSTWARPRPRTSYLKADPNIIGANSEADTCGYTRCRRRRSSSSARPSPSPSSSTGTPGPDFASTVMIPALQDVHPEPRTTSTG